jgi:hypothetical protein
MLAQIVVAEAEPLRHTRPIVLDEQVGFRDKRKEAFHLLGILHVDGDTALVAIDGRKVAALHRPAGAFNRRRPCTHAVAAVRSLDLHDVRAEIGKQTSRERPCCDLCEFKNLDAVERALHHSIRMYFQNERSGSLAIGDGLAGIAERL